MKIHLATDHAGFSLKEELKTYIISLGHEVVDHGALSHEEGDAYPAYIAKAAKEVSQDSFHAPSYGVIFGGSGQGEAIVANRFPHVRAIVYAGGDLELVRLGREHNDANIISFGARFVTTAHAKEALDLFLATSFSHAERHAERVIQIEEVSKP